MGRNLGVSETVSPVVEGLMQKLASQDAKVGVIGLGYVGLPLAMAFAEAGVIVTGFDVDQARVTALNAGKSPVDDINDAVLVGQLARGTFTATADRAKMAEQDALFVCVPTPIRETKDPDLSYLIAAAEAIAVTLKAGQLVVLESTTYPGTTEEVVKPILEASGFQVGTDVFLSFSPERVDPGNKTFTVKDTPKVIGGCTQACSALAATIYGRFIGTEKLHLVSSPQVAEMTKLLENIFRSVNIALVNEFSILCNRMGIDAWEVTRAAATKPFGFMPFQPGPGVGGHCIPIDPYYLAWKAREYDFRTRFIELAAEVNNQMPVQVAARVTEALNSVGKPLRGSKVLVLGVTFKRDLSDFRNSPVLKVMELLNEACAEVTYHDPHVVNLPGPTTRALSTGPSEWQSQEIDDAALREADCVVIGVDHSAFDYEQIGRSANLIVDTRDVMRSVHQAGTVWRL